MDFRRHPRFRQGGAVFAELGSTYPRSGGEYVYLSRAFGSLVGYLFAWAQLVVIRPGSIAAMAYVFCTPMSFLASPMPSRSAVLP
ncbi:MAG: amino acid permease [Gemmataceae bacterium]